MFRKSWKQFSAVALAVMLAFGNGSMAMAVGIEGEDVPSADGIQQEATVDTPGIEEDSVSIEYEEAGEVPPESDVTENVGTESAGPENGAPEEEPKEALADAEPLQDLETVIEDGEPVIDTEELPDGEILIEEVTGEAFSVDMEALGFHGMDLSREQWAAKYDMTNDLAVLPDMVEGIDCAEKEVIFAADSQEEAEKIADCYNAEPIEFEYGIGVLKLGTDMKAAVYCAAQTDNNLPPVYPNDYDYLMDVDDMPLALTKPNDTHYDKQGYLASMDADDAWQYTKGKDITVAVIDTGIDYDHEDLNANIIGYKSMISDEAHPKDANGHGTHCAGIVAAVQGNEKGISGVAPEAKIFAIQAGDSSGFDRENTIQAINYAVSQHVDVISMSLGGGYYNSLYYAALQAAFDAGIVVVAAAGNDGLNQITYPAGYDGVISVAATYSEENRLDENYSNYGSWVDVSAPGTRIYSTVPKSKDNTTGYGYKSGTSMACPAVAGTVALMLSSDPDLRAIEGKKKAEAVRERLKTTGEIPMKSSYGSYRYPRVNAMNALSTSVGGELSAPVISFFDNTGRQISPNGKKIASGDGYYFTLSAKPSYAKIYYTVNGAKPDVDTGYEYEPSSPFKMEMAGSMKVQAVAVAGGKKSKVVSATYTCEPVVTGIKCYGNKPNMQIMPGKSIQLEPSFEPLYANNVKCVWTCDDITGVLKVNAKTGKLTCSKSAPLGKTARVTAAVDGRSTLSCTFNITVSDTRTDGISLSATELLMSQWAGTPGLNMTGYVKEADLLPVSATGQFKFKSSNVKVATVDDRGHVKAGEKSGTASITVTANDGSGKKAVCKVKVANPIYKIDGVTSTGYDRIGNGCSIKISTTINDGVKGQPLCVPANKKLVWTSSDPSLITVSGSGVVKCKKDAPDEQEVKITAEAKDGFGAKWEYVFKTRSRIKNIVSLSGRRLVTSRTLILASGGGNKHLGLDFSPVRNGVIFTTLKTTNSNGNAVYLGEDGLGWYVIPRGRGKSVIKFKTLDGGGATYKLIVKVM